MEQQTEELIDLEEEKLNKINDQRRLWLWASSFVFWSIISIIFMWDWIDGLHSKSFWWVIVSFMLILSINWWYWTMRVMRLLIHHQMVQYNILKMILVDLGKIKKDVRDHGGRHVDNDF